MPLVFYRSQRFKRKRYVIRGGGTITFPCGSGRSESAEQIPSLRRSPMRPAGFPHIWAGERPNSKRNNGCEGHSGGCCRDQSDGSCSWSVQRRRRGVAQPALACGHFATEKDANDQIASQSSSAAFGKFRSFLVHCKGSSTCSLPQRHLFDPETPIWIGVGTYASGTSGRPVLSERLEFGRGKLAHVL